MSHGIIESMRDFVFGIIGQGNDWHKLTIEKPALTSSLFPTMEPHVLYYDFNGQKHASGESVLVATDDGKPCGGAFNPETFGYILPQVAWEKVMDALKGTHYTVERMGMLWNRSFWFVSVSLDELKTLARPGESFQLNFSGGLDGSKSPQAELSHIRAVCHNTISISRATGTVLFKIKQTSQSQGRLDKAAAEVETACGMAQVFNRTLATLEAQPLSVPDARALFAGEVINRGGNFDRPISSKTGIRKESRGLNLVNDLVALFQRGDGNNGETRADALNAFTQRMTRGSAEGTDSKKNPWTAVASSEFSNNATRKAEFLNVVADEDTFTATVNTGRKALAEAKA